ncbi:hypothetical protein ABIB94_008433 [Bradyrhizobium sp. JR7.2]
MMVGTALCAFAHPTASQFCRELLATTSPYGSPGLNGSCFSGGTVSSAMASSIATIT